MHPVLLLMIGCAGKDDTGAPEVTGPPDPAILSIDIEDNPTLVLEKVLAVELDQDGAVAAACAPDADPADVHLVESAAGTSHRLPINGLLPSSAYTCDVGILGLQSPAPTSVTFTTPALPASLPAVSATTTPGQQPSGGYTLFNHQRMCADEKSIRLGAADHDGRIRWYYELPAEGFVDTGLDYAGDGLIMWGGMSASDRGAGAPTLLTASHEVVYKASYPGAGNTYFHHDVTLEDDGTLIALTDVEASVDGRGLVGFEVHHIDPQSDSLLWSWSVQQALDAGQLEAQGVEDFGANWAGYLHDGQQEVMAISLCDSNQIIGVDPASGNIRWTFGQYADLTLADADPGGQARWSYCQHGLDVDGSNLLVYDNGWEADESRAVEFAFDLGSQTVTQTWSWTEANWWSFIWGDVDYLADERILITKAQASCFSPYPNEVTEVVELDRATDQVVWRLSMGDPIDGGFSAVRVDGCELFDRVVVCDTLAARLDELAPDLGRG